MGGGGRRSDAELARATTSTSLTSPIESATRSARASARVSAQRIACIETSAPTFSGFASPMPENVPRFVRTVAMTTVVLPFSLVGSSTTPVVVSERPSSWASASSPRKEIAWTRSTTAPRSSRDGDFHEVRVVFAFHGVLLSS